MRLKKYLARNVPVLNLSYTPNADGDVFPPEATVRFLSPIRVVYDFDYEKVIGKAYLMRVGNKIIADLYLVSGVDDEAEAEMLIQQMYPAASCISKDRHKNIVLSPEITAVSLSFNKSKDPNVEQLGVKVKRDRKPGL